MFYIYSLSIGLVAGVLSGLFGIGGGIVIVPLLALFFKLAPHEATSTSLIAMMIPLGAIAGAWQYYQKSLIQPENFKMGILISLGLLAGATIGAKFALSLSGPVLTKAFAVLLVVVATRMWWTA